MINCIIAAILVFTLSFAFGYAIGKAGFYIYDRFIKPEPPNNMFTKKAHREAQNAYETLIENIEKAKKDRR